MKPATCRPISIACAIALGLGLAAPASAELGDNPGYRDAYTAWAGAHLALLPTAFLPGPFGTVADLSTIAIDIRLRFLPALFIAPELAPVLPNSSDSCRYDFTLPQKSADYSNLFNLWDIQPLTTDWGAFGMPVVGHGNSPVRVSVDAPLLDGWSTGHRQVSFPSGTYPLRWRAETQLDPIFDIALPTALFAYSAEFKYGEAITSTDPQSAARAFAIGKTFLANAGVELGVIAAGELSDNTITAATHQQIRNFSVLDVRPPQIATSMPSPPPIEASGFGGEPWQHVRPALRATVTASDPCGLTPSVGDDAPDYLPLGATTVTWTAYDIGPLGGGNSGVASVQQHVVVQDTRPPILLAPPSRVVESSVPPAPAQVELGTAVAFDVADAEPLITSTAPTSFPVNARTEVVWTATDASGNSAQKSQWVTVKTPGTNTQPAVANAAAQTLTSEPVDIVLSGSDGDFLSGRFDPLNFHIVDPPSHGFFVAPLTPYFIEDYRVQPDSEVGAILDFSSNPAADLDAVFCHANPPRPLPVDFVYNAQFVHIRDDDTAFVLDEAWRCTNDYPVTDPRISKWSADGELVAATDARFGAGQVNRVIVDAGGEVQAVSPASSSDALVLRRYQSDLSSFVSWQIDSTQPLNRTPKHVTAIYDALTGIIYANDKEYVFAYDGNDGNYHPTYIGALNGGQGFLSRAPSAAGSSTRGFTMEIDSTGALYISDPGTHRIYKFAPSTYDGANFVAGALVGWLGRCDSGPNCDDEHGRSFGYSCTDATCNVSTASGAGEGQFSTPLGIALDPDDILYVTDYDNSRVQRFTPLGDFAGQASSTCDGSCFVLGDMGRPIDISVNSSKFYVLDRDHALMHVFETAPFKDISESSVTVSYASDNDFQGTDQFRFRADDGLASSTPGTATIQVQRNYRPPEAHPGQHALNEDTSLNFELEASDPDGIAGVDFNGLDTLTYSVVEPPAHGSLGGSGANRTYTPAPDFNGSDSFSFRVNDGVFDSDVAQVDIDVQPVNDPPVVRFTDQNSSFVPRQAWPLLRGKIIGGGLVAGRGFPAPLLAEYEDPDANDPHFLQVIWGDGSSDQANDVTPIDPDDPHRPPVITPTFEGKGQVVGNHIYTDNGSYPVLVTVLDSTGSYGEVQTTLDVIDMVDLVIEPVGEAPDPAPPGSVVTLTLDLTSAAPDAGVPGIDATGVVFTGTLPTGVALLNATTTQGGCTHVDPVTTCTIGTLAPGAVVTISVTVQPDLYFDPAHHAYQVDATSNEPDASGENLRSIAIPVLPGPYLFHDGFD